MANNTPNHAADLVSGAPDAGAKPVSILRKRLRKFRTLKRGHYSFILIVALYVLSFMLPLFIEKKAILVHYNGEITLTLFGFHPGSEFGQIDPVSGKPSTSETDYRKLAEEFDKPGNDNWVIMPFYTWSPNENDLESVLEAPSSEHWFGTDDIGRDVFARMAYGFNTSLSFALILVILEFFIGTAIGAFMGYFGGKVDLFGQRLVEIWSNVPFLYTVIIISSIVQPSFLLLVVLIAAFDWVAITYYIRGEFYREKAKDYVAAAIALGAGSGHIIFKHILPNSLTPLIARLPFSIIAAIFALVSLDYLGFGLPPPTPSWGQMVGVGLTNIAAWWLVVTPLSAMFLTLLLITFIGEAIREAFDPRVYSRLQ